MFPQEVHLVSIVLYFPILPQVKVNVHRPHALHSRVLGEDCEAVKGLLLVMVGIDLPSFPVVYIGDVSSWEDKEIKDALEPSSFLRALFPFFVERDRVFRIVFILPESCKKLRVKRKIVGKLLRLTRDEVLYGGVLFNSPIGRVPPLFGESVYVPELVLKRAPLVGLYG